MVNLKNEKYQCPVEYTLKVIGGKWKPVILWLLSTGGAKRYGEVKRALGTISHKMLSQQLKELEANGMLHREEYHQIPPKVEYSLTEKGKTLLPILNEMANWGLQDKNSTQNCKKE